MARKLAAVVFSLGCIHASSTFALGLGDLKLESFLNEPLKAKVDLLNTDGLHADQIRIRLATREDFEGLLMAAVDRDSVAQLLTFESPCLVITQADGSVTWPVEAEAGAACPMSCSTSRRSPVSRLYASGSDAELPARTTLTYRSIPSLDSV